MLASLVKKALDCGVFLFVEHGQLKFKQTKPTFPEELKRELKIYKAELISYLAKGAENLPKLKAGESEEHETLSYNQRRLWFIDSYSSGSPQYNILAVLGIRGVFEPLRAEWAINCLIQRHNILQSNYYDVDGEPRVKLSSQRKFVFQKKHLTSQVEIENWLNEYHKTAFNLSIDPLLQGVIVDLPQEEKAEWLIFKTHHIVFDGVSLPIFIKEFETLYNQYSSAELVRLPVQYGDYANWEKQLLEGGYWEPGITYWLKHLEQAPATHNLPLLAPRINDFGTHRKLEKVWFNDKETQTFKEIAASYQITDFMLLHSFLALLISRFSNQSDIVIGTPVANREQVELEKIIGYFANTLALRVNTRHESLKDYLTHVKKVHLDAQTYQAVPFELVVEKLGLSGKVEHTPVFQVLLSIQTGNQESLSLEKCELTPLKRESMQSDFELDIRARMENGSIFIEWLYNPKLFSNDLVKRLADGMKHLLAAINCDPSQPLHQLNVLSESERQELDNLSGGTVNFGFKETPVGLFEKQVEHIGNNIAVSSSGLSLTYQELNERANQIARYLLAHHIGRGDIVGVCMDRTPTMIAVLLGIMKSGAAYAPLDPEYPYERLLFIVEDLSLQWVVTQNSHYTKISSIEHIQLCVVDDYHERDSLSQQPVHNPATSVSSADLAYIVYTSGSTGEPKGVMITQKNIAALVSWALRTYPKEALSHVLASTSMNFDLSTFEVFSALCSGGECVLVDSVLTLTELDDDKRISLVNTVPSGMRAILSQGSLPASVRWINLAGEPLSRTLVNQILALQPKATVTNLYGPSEDTTYSTCFVMTKEQLREPPIGRPIDFKEAHVVNFDGSLTPLGCTGELYLSGAGVSPGYWKRHELTNEKFCLLEHGKRKTKAYRSGDLVYYDSNGELVFVGRRDAQVKLRGYRIELGEIEAWIRRYENVRDTAVIIRTIEEDKQLVAYVDETETGLLRQSRLILWLQRFLPKYMLPDIVVTCDSFPLTQNGKIDRQKLIAEPLAQDIHQPAQPLTSEQKKVAEAWAGVLSISVAQVQFDSDFFGLGGHSLLAVKLVNQLRQKSLMCSLRTLFNFPRFGDFFEQLSINDEESIESRKPDKEDLKYPLSDGQRRLWFIDALQGQSIEYHMPFLIQLPSYTAPEILAEAIRIILNRHVPLRSVFAEVSGKPQQRTLSSERWKMSSTVIDNFDFNATEFISGERERINREPFDLSRDYPIRANYTEIKSDNKAYLSLCIHHIAFDGWSADIFLRELRAYYTALAKQIEPEVEKTAIDFIDYVLWSQQPEQIKHQEAALKYWSKQLIGLPMEHGLPLKKERPRQKEYQSKELKGVFEGTTFRRFKKLSEYLKMTPFMLLHSLLNLVISRFSGVHDVVIGTPVANRERDELSHLIGFFSNTLVLRSDTRKESLKEYLEHIKSINQEALINQSAPFEQVVEQHCSQPTTRHSPLFQILLTLNNDIKQASSGECGEVCWQPINIQKTLVKFDLEVFISLQKNRALISWCYDISLFEERLMQIMLDEFLMTVDELTMFLRNDEVSTNLALQKAKPGQLFGGNSHKSLLVEAQGKPKECLIQEPFERQARKSPAKIAIEDRDQLYSYGDIEVRANKIAHYLNQQGFCPGQRVAVQMQRSVWQIVTLLACLKAGLVYVPLDSRLPVKRRQYQCDKAQVSLVISERELTDVQVISTSPLNICELVESPIWSSLPESVLEIERCGRDEAYILYTSGSTGEPKGVVQQHETVTRLANFHIKENGVRALRTLQFTPITFDVSFQELGVAWATGSCLVLISQQEKDDFSCLARLLNKRKIERVFVPPLICQQIATQALNDELRLDLREIFVAGDIFVNSRELVTWIRESPNLNVYNHYGPTETNVVCASCVNFQLDSERFSIGEVLPEHKASVLDCFGKELPKGYKGEFFVSGPQVGQGYLSHDSTRFIFKEGYYPGYFTGDQVYQDNKGQYHFINRQDRQISIRGYRIEPEEIRRALIGSENVVDAYVLARGDDGSKALHAYVELRAGAGIDWLTEVNSHLSSEVPNYMLPNYFYVIDIWPTTVNGKLDQEALALLQPEKKIRQGKGVSGSKQKSLALIWSDLLSLDLNEITEYSNFFELGGSSLKLVELLAKVRQQLKLSFNLAEFYRNPSFSALSELCEPIENDLSSLRHTEERDDHLYPLSCGQERFIALNQLDGSAQSYNIQAGIDVPKPFDKELVCYSIELLIERHEILRTQIRLVNGKFYQLIQQELDVDACYRHYNVKTGEEIEVITKTTQDCLFAIDSPTPVRFSFIECSGRTGFRLLITMPHIASDGQSIQLLFQQFLEQYLGVTAVEQNETFQFRDYMFWQRTYLESSEYEQSLAYWKQQLSGLPIHHSLPLDYPRPLVKQYKAGQCRMLIGQKQGEILRDTARKNGLSPFMLFHAWLALVISRFSRCHDVSIGVPVSGRTLMGMERVVGYLSNSLVLRTKTDMKTVSEYIEHIKQINAEAQAHQQVPFDKVVAAVEPRRSASHTPLFQILLTLNEEPIKDGSHPEILDVIKPAGGGEYSAKFDLDLAVNERTEGYELLWHYDSALFSQDSVQRFVDYYTAIMSQWLRDTPKKLCELGEHFSYHQLLQRQQAFLPVRAEFPNIANAFFQYARERPKSCALIDGLHKVSYAELWREASELAFNLERLGYKSDQCIAVMLPRSKKLVVTLLACCLKGICYVPLDEQTPRKRLLYILKDSKARLLIVNKGQEIRNSPCRQISYLQLIKSSQDAPFYSAPTFSGKKPAYIIYTSGTTGRPKGVQQSHHNLLRLLNSASRSFDWENNDVWIMFHSPAFDFSVWEMWGALLNGASLVLPSYQETRNPQKFIELCQLHGVTVLNQTPSAFRQMFSELSQQTQCRRQLRYIILGGEEVNKYDLKHWLRRYGEGQPKLINMYGITETCVHVTFKHMTLNPGGMSAGKELSDQMIYIVDQDRLPLPNGAVGEIAVAGAGLACGYVNAPKETDVAFRKNPYANKEMSILGYENLYLSGDLGRINCFGELEHMGRLDQQVQINGYRIELAEITFVLSAVREVSESIVLKYENESETCLVAFIVLKEGGKESHVEEVLRREIVDSLPIYMMPHEFVFVKNIPRNQNGKIDIEKLWQNRDEYKQSSKSAVMPLNNEYAQPMKDAWGKILRKAIGFDDDFFGSGGNSIKAVELVEELNNCGISVTLRELYVHQSIRQLINCVDSETKNHLIEVDIDVPNQVIDLAEKYWEDRIEDIYPVTSMQSEMIKYYGTKPGVYHPQQLIEFDNDSFDLLGFQKVVDYLVIKHPSMRTRFLKYDSFFYQVVLAHQKQPVIYQDLSELNGSDKSYALHLLYEHDTENSFETTHRNIRFTIVKLTSRRYALMLSAHHAIEDGWGVIEMLNEMLRLYLDGIPEHVTASPDCVKELLQLESQAQQDESIEKVWQKLLRQYEPFPMDLGSSEECSRWYYKLSSKKLRDLQEWCRTKNTIVKAVFSSCFAKSLGGIFGCSTITYDSIMTQRHPKLSEPLTAFGLFWSFCPVVSDVQKSLLQVFNDTTQYMHEADSNSLYPRKAVQALIGGETPLPFAYKFVDFHNEQTTESNRVMSTNRTYASDIFHHTITFSVSVQSSGEVQLMLESYVGLEHRVLVERIVNTLWSKIELLVDEVSDWVASDFELGRLNEE